MERIYPESHTTQPARRKCCEKCAFRHGSPETADGYGWAHLVEGFQMGRPFYCHETVPGHYQENADAGDRWQVCGGWSAHNKTGFKGAMTVAYLAARGGAR